MTVSTPLPTVVLSPDEASTLTFSRSLRRRINHSGSGPVQQRSH